MGEIKNLIDGFNSILETVEDKISEIGYRVIGNTKKRDNRMINAERSARNYGR